MRNTKHHQPFCESLIKKSIYFVHKLIIRCRRWFTQLEQIKTGIIQSNGNLGYYDFKISQYNEMSNVFSSNESTPMMGSFTRLTVIVNECGTLNICKQNIALILIKFLRSIRDFFAINKDVNLHNFFFVQLHWFISIVWGKKYETKRFHTRGRPIVNES